MAARGAPETGARSQGRPEAQEPEGFGRGYRGARAGSHRVGYAPQEHAHQWVSRPEHLHLLLHEMLLLGFGGEAETLAGGRCTRRYGGRRGRGGRHGLPRTRPTGSRSRPRSGSRPRKRCSPEPPSRDRRRACRRVGGAALAPPPGPARGPLALRWVGSPGAGAARGGRVPGGCARSAGPSQVLEAAGVRPGLACSLFGRELLCCKVAACWFCPVSRSNLPAEGNPKAFNKLEPLNDFKVLHVPVFRRVTLHGSGGCLEYCQSLGTR